MEQTESLRSW